VDEPKTTGECATSTPSPSGGTHTFGALTIGGLGIYNLDAHDVTVNITGNLSNSGIAILGSGTVTVANGSATNNITNTGTLTSTSGNLIVAGSFTNTNGEFYHNNGTVIFIDDGIITPVYNANRPTVNVFMNIIKRGVGTITSIALNSTLYVLGDVTVEEGTIAGQQLNNTMHVEGNVLVSDKGAIDLSNPTSFLILDPPVTTVQRFNPGILSTYRHVTKQGLGKTQLVTHPLTTVSNLLILDGIFNAGDLNVTVGSTLDISAGAEMIMGTGALTASNGLTSISGTLTTDAKADPQHTFATLSISAGGVYDNDEIEVIVNATGSVINNGTIIIGIGPVNFAHGFTNNNMFTSTPGILNVSGGNFVNTG